MKAAFAYMGNIYIPLRTLFSGLGIELVVPPPPNNKTLNLGARLATETMCIPFKLTLGNIIKAMDMGADTVIHPSDVWSCRFGYYGRRYCYILKDLGYKFDRIDVAGHKFWEHYRTIKSLNKNSDILTTKAILEAIYRAYNKSSVMEFIEQTARNIRPYEIEKGFMTRILDRYLRALDKITSVKEMKQLKKRFVSDVNTIKKDLSRQPLKIKIVGESYCVVEPFVNFNLIQVLGENGILVDPFLTAHKWLGFHSIRLGNQERKLIKKLAHPYWKYNVGGEDENAVGYSLLAAQQGYDGIICLHPFGCMSSTAVQPVLQKISRDKNIPYLDIGLDEQTSETGFNTRIDAFISVLEKRRKLVRVE